LEERAAAAKCSNSPGGEKTLERGIQSILDAVCSLDNVLNRFRSGSPLVETMTSLTFFARTRLITRCCSPVDSH
jgi:hypothetical protein